MKKILILSAIFFGSGVALASSVATCESGTILKTYDAVKWYRVSAEKKAIYRQTYDMAYKYVKSTVKADKLAKHQWGVVLDIDETTLDNSDYYAYQLNVCDNSTYSEDRFSHYAVIDGYAQALPGVRDYTCKVQALGGYVSLVTNRDGSYVESTGNVVDKTVANLKKEGICFDQVLFAAKLSESNLTVGNKNPRFAAIEHGKYNDYQMVYTNKIPKHKVIAYSGDNIQDFPNLSQKSLVDIKDDDSVFDKFGNGYFILPNPMYGSWLGVSFK